MSIESLESKSGNLSFLLEHDYGITSKNVPWHLVAHTSELEQIFSTPKLNSKLKKAFPKDSLKMITKRDYTNAGSDIKNKTEFLPRDWSEIFRFPLVITIAHMLDRLDEEQLQNLPVIEAEMNEKQYVENLLGYLDPRVATWKSRQLSQKKQHPDKSLFSIDKWDLLYAHPNFEEFLQATPDSELVSSFNVSTMLFALNHLDFIRKLEDQYKTLKFSQGKYSWEEMMVSFEDTMSYLGHYPVDHKIINHALVENYCNQTENPRAAREEFDHLTPQEYLTRIYYLRNTHSFASMVAVKQKVLEDPEIFAQINQQRAEQVKRTSWLESKFNPIAHLLPSLGWEIEDAITPEIPTEILNYFRAFGLRHTYGREISPDPVWHWQTGQYVIGNLVQSHLCDLYDTNQRYLLSLHANIGKISNIHLAAHLMRFLQLTGYAWCPRFHTSTEDELLQELEIHPNLKEKNESISYGFMRGVGQNYYETKSFKLISLDGFLHHARLQGRLGVLYTALSKVDQKLHPSAKSIEDYIKPSVAQLHRLNLTPEVFELARLGLQFHDEINYGLSQTNVNNYLNKNIAMTTARNLAKTSEKILPSAQPWIRDTVDVNNPVEMNQQIPYEGIVYNNAIAFSRAIGEKYGVLAEQVLAQGVVEFATALSAIQQKFYKNQQTKADHLFTLFSRFPCGLNNPKRIPLFYLNARADATTRELKAVGILTPDLEVDTDRIYQIFEVPRPTNP